MKKRPVIRIFIHRHRIELIMWAFIANVLVSPLADYHRHAGLVLGLLVFGTVLAGVTILADRKVVRFAVLPAAGIWLVARALEAFGDSAKLYAQLAPVAGLILSCAVLLAIFDHFNSVPRVPRSAIAEAFVSYLVIAIAFSQLYWILNRFVDHAFNQPVPESQSGTLLYFSMITLSGVGYGGIAPVNPYVRMVAALESMAGIFFVAVVVARLVSSYRSESRSAHPSDASKIEDRISHN